MVLAWFQVLSRHLLEMTKNTKHTDTGLNQDGIIKKQIRTGSWEPNPASLCSLPPLILSKTANHSTATPDRYDHDELHKYGMHKLLIEERKDIDNKSLDCITIELVEYYI
jgi:hypothetical protein